MSVRERSWPVPVAPVALSANPLTSRDAGMTLFHQAQPGDLLHLLRLRARGPS